MISFTIWINATIATNANVNNNPDVNLFLKLLFIIANIIKPL